MVTLKSILAQNGVYYNTVFKQRAEDIWFDDSEELFEALGYILAHYKRFDFEIPEDHKAILGSYQIANGLTSGGYEMKYAGQYRIYFQTIENMPTKLCFRLQADDKMRITGSLFVEACGFLGFVPGAFQNIGAIKNNINSLIHTENEKKAFIRGLNL